MVWYHVVVVREFEMTNCAYPLLLNNFAIQEFSHLGR